MLDRPICVWSTSTYCTGSALGALSGTLWAMMSFLRRYWPSCVLGATGVVALVAGLIQQVGRDLLAGELVFLGVGALVLSAFAPRISNMEFGPKGMKASLTANEHQVEESTGYLSGDDVLEPGESLEQDEVVIGARTALAGEAIATLLAPEPDSILHGSILRMYLLDEDEQLLVPMIRSGDPEPHDVERFRLGCGATGTSFARGEFVYVDGDAISDATYGLTQDQQRYFARLSAVASLPVANAVGTVIGALTASTDAEDGPEKLSTEDAYYDLLVRSLALARVLVDVLKWFDDE